MKCVPSPLHPLFHHLTCVRAAAATLEMLGVSDCPPKISLVLPVPPSPTAPLSGAAPQHQAQGFRDSIWGFPPFQGGLSGHTDTGTLNTNCLMLFQSVSAAAGLLVPKKGTLGPCPLHPGRSLSPFHVPFVLQRFLSITAGSSCSLHTQNVLLVPSPGSAPALPLPVPGFPICLYFRDRLTGSRLSFSFHLLHSL